MATANIDASPTEDDTSPFNSDTTPSAPTEEDISSLVNNPSSNADNSGTPGKDNSDTPVKDYSAISVKDDSAIPVNDSSDTPVKDKFLTLNDDDGCSSIASSVIASPLKKPQKFHRKQAKKIKIKINLIAAAQHEIEFLREVNKYPLLYKGDVVKRAIERYEQLWLPLAAKHPNTVLVPPLDIHWVWYVHMLSPENYEKDCKEIVGCVINHKLKEYSYYSKNWKSTYNLWKEIYKKPFTVDLNTEEGIKLNKYISKIDYDLESAIARQALFFYQVSMHHYLKSKFLQKAFDRYKQLLYLKAENLSLFLVPCYDMDVIWHAHMAHPIQYAEETRNILGGIFKHDDSVNDRTPGSKLNTSQVSTSELWNQTYGEDFRRNGSMFRGNPPSEYLKSVPMDFEKDLHVHHYALRIAKLFVTGVPEGNFKIKIRTPFDNTYTTLNERLFKLNFSSSGLTECEHDVSDQQTAFQLTDTDIKNSFTFSIARKSEGFFSSSKKPAFNHKCAFSFNDLLKLNVGRGSIKTHSQILTVKIEIEFHIQVKRLAEYCPLTILSGPFITVFLNAEDMRSRYGIMVDVDKNGQCKDTAVMATHRMTNVFKHGLPTIFEVEGSRDLVGVAHTVDNCQLPAPEDAPTFSYIEPTSGREYILDKEKGERAMLIKTKGGDEHLVIGKWAGLVAGRQADETRGGLPGNPGHLRLKWTDYQYNEEKTLKMKIDDNYHNLSWFDKVYHSIDMKNGIIQLGYVERIVPTILFALCQSVMHVLCHPRDTKNESSVRKKKLPVEEYEMLDAFGYNNPYAPHNGYIMDLGYVFDGCGGCGSCGGCGACGGCGSSGSCAGCVGFGGSGGCGS